MTVATAAPPAAGQILATGPTHARSSPAATSSSAPAARPGQANDRRAGESTGFDVLPSSESGDVTRILLLGLLGLFVLVVIPTQVAKDVAQRRRRRAATAPARVRRSRDHR